MADRSPPLLGGMNIERRTSNIERRMEEIEEWKRIEEGRMTSGTNGS
jgi:hypothetical protein